MKTINAIHNLSYHLFILLALVGAIFFTDAPTWWTWAFNVVLVVGVTTVVVSFIQEFRKA